MVYCGKLSKACLPCRKRRLPCDLRKAGCGQCKRAKLTCWGYQDQKAIRIRDETTAAQQKVIRRSTAVPLVASIDVSRNHLAKELFYHDHVLGETKGYNFMRQYYSLAARDEHLIKSIAAVSLAYLNHQKHHVRAQMEARQQYIGALKLTSKALQSPMLATSDSTMLSILLLDLYEKISSIEPRFDGAWGAHLKGALSLIQLRGEAQYHDCDSLRMLERLSTNILISCVVSDRAVPDDLISLQAAVTSPAKRHETELMVKFARLKNQVKHDHLSDDAIVRAALELDVQFLDLSRQLPSSWQHKTAYTDVKTAHHYEAYHYTYAVEYIGQMWNVLRITRILICELILTHCQKLPIDVLPGFGQVSPKEYAIIIIEQMSREICATVPQCIGNYAEQPDARPYASFYRLIFPLYVAAQSTPASQAIKQYVIQQLRFMAENYAVENALVVSEILESGQKMDPWQVYALLGSYAFVC